MKYVCLQVRSTVNHQTGNDSTSPACMSGPFNPFILRMLSRYTRVSISAGLWREAIRHKLSPYCTITCFSPVGFSVPGKNGICACPKDSHNKQGEQQFIQRNRSHLRFQVNAPSLRWLFCYHRNVLINAAVCTVFQHGIIISQTSVLLWIHINTNVCLIQYPKEHLFYLILELMFVRTVVLCYNFPKRY